jgi:hypothetical protein
LLDLVNSWAITYYGRAACRVRGLQPPPFASQAETLIALVVVAAGAETLFALDVVAAAV